jgi:hypothetical protein
MILTETRYCFCRELLFDEEGNLLDEKRNYPKEVAMRKMISDSRNRFEELIQMAKNLKKAWTLYFLTCQA